MKNYFKSLFPCRWILLGIFVLLTSIFFILSYQVTKSNYFIIGFIFNIPFWMIIDFFFGIGQEDYWTRNKNS